MKRIKGEDMTETELHYLKEIIVPKVGKLLDEYEDLEQIHEDTKYKIERLASIHSEAECNILMEKLSAESEKKQGISELLTYYEYQKQVHFFFEIEKILYEETFNLHYKEYEDRPNAGGGILGRIWHAALDKFEFNSRTDYPIRYAVHRVCMDYMTQMAHARDFVAEGSFERELLELARSFVKSHSDRVMYRRYDAVNKFLALWRRNRPGSIGHYFWVVLYVSELVLFRKSYRYESSALYHRIFAEGIENKAIGHLIAEYETAIDNQSVAISSYVNAHQPVANLVNENKREVDRVRGILHRDPELRNIYIHLPPVNNGGSSGTPKSKCFAILTNGTERYVAISGYRTDLYNLCKSVFSRKPSGLHTYFVSSSEYEKSLYAWEKNGTASKVVSMRKSDALMARKGKKISATNLKIVNPPGDLKRMFSCSERRLVDTYNNLSNRNGYRIISRWEPCYMCNQVLEKNTIPIFYLELNPNGNLPRNTGFDDWGRDVYYAP